MKLKVALHNDLLNFVRPSPHSTFSPSASDRWLLNGCPYSIKACKDIPEETSIYAEEGTVAHSLCEAVFRKNYLGLEIPKELLMQTLDYDSDEMMECAEGYSNVLTHWINNKELIGKPIYYGLEKGIPIFPEEGCFGTADCLIVGEKAAVIIDYKHGKGKNVSATSTQLKTYLAGVYKYLVNVPEDYKFYAVVYQPRTDMAPKEASYTKEDMRSFLSYIQDSIAESKKPNLQPVEGKHCFWCPASRTRDLNFKCPIIKERPLKLAQENFGKFLADMSGPVESLADKNVKRDEAMIKLIAIYPMIKQVVEQSTEEIKMRLQDGEAISGVRIVDKEGKRTLSFADDKEAVETLKKVFPKLNPVKIIPATEKLKTITEIEKEIGRGKLDPFCVKKITKEIEVLNDKQQAILGELVSFSNSLTNSEEE